jgi:hypothetical protein
VNRLYQWLYKRASFLRTGSSGHSMGRVVRTEVTVERQGIILLDGGPAANFDECPLCGQKLAPTQAEQARLRLLKGSISPEDPEKSEPAV